MDDHDIVLTIREMLDGVEWTPDTLEDIASLLRKNGYHVAGRKDIDLEELTKEENA